MTEPYRFNVDDGVLRRDGARLDAWRWRWTADAATAGASRAGRAVTPREALVALAETGSMRAIPVGVIGPRDASADQMKTARAVGGGLAEMGLTVICGGRTGVMAAVSQGVRAAGGLSVGLLPGHDWREANVDVVLPIATGLSEARNMVIAKASAVLIAVGGSYGTLTEVAYGLHFGKPVIGLTNPPRAPGLELADSPEDALDRLASHLLAQVSEGDQAS